MEVTSEKFVNINSVQLAAVHFFTEFIFYIRLPKTSLNLENGRELQSV